MIHIETHVARAALDEMIDALIAADQLEQLANLE